MMKNSLKASFSLIFDRFILKAPVRIPLRKMSGGKFTQKRKFLIDTDAGLDDAQAILMALTPSIDIDVVAITTVHGNAATNQASMNILRLLKVAGRLDIPVFTGTQQSILGTRGDSSHYHGKDGFGDSPDDNPPSASLLQNEHAVSALTRLVNKHAGEITLVALGPLTNIAMAIRLDPGFGKKLKECFIMGGNYKGMGNITVAGEFNFHTDPEAAYIVLNELQCPVTIACWELCVDYSLSWEFYQELRDKPNCVKSLYLKEKERRMYLLCEKENWPTYVPCDELAMASAIDPSIITQSEECTASVELAGNLTRGQMVVNWNNLHVIKSKTSLTIVQKIDMERYQKMLHNIYQL